jgi:menaquinone-9 beta-reductase
MDAADVVVVGGGPAGLATAIGARLRGLSVIVVEGRRPPLDKACGEGVMPDGVAALARLGVVVPGRRFWGICWRQEGSEVHGRFPASPGLGVRRPALHGALAARAEALGVDLRWGVRVQGMADQSVLTAGGAVGGRFLVGADGLHSRMRHWAGLASDGGRHKRFGVRRHLAIPPWSEEVEVTWGEGAEAYVTPVAAREVGVALLWSGKGAGGFDALLRRFPELAERLRGAPASSRDRGAGPFHQRVRGVVRGHLALVGDAAGYLDALTGEGVGLAVQQAEALAAALAAADLGRYRRAHRRLGRLPGALTALLLVAERRPRLRRRLLAALAADPPLFSRLLGVHSRQLPPAALGALPAGRLLLALAGVRAG